MKLQYVRAFIVLLAGLIALIVNMKTGKPVTMSLFIVLVVLIVFYFIGTLVVELLQKSLEPLEGKVSDADEPETAEDDGEQRESDEEAPAFAFDDDEEIE